MYKYPVLVFILVFFVMGRPLSAVVNEVDPDLMPPPTEDVLPEMSPPPTEGAPRAPKAGICSALTAGAIAANAGLISALVILALSNSHAHSHSH